MDDLDPPFMASHIFHEYVDTRGQHLWGKTRDPGMGPSI